MRQTQLCHSQLFPSPGLWLPLQVSLSTVHSSLTPLLSFLSDLSFSLVLTFLSGNQRVWHHLSNHWLNTDQNRTSCWKWLVSLSSKGRFGNKSIECPFVHVMTSRCGASLPLTAFPAPRCCSLPR